jgi:hypothetical protein
VTNVADSLPDDQPEPWLDAYLNQGADLREAGAIGGISHEEVRLRLRERGIHVRTAAETLAMRTKLAASKHGDSIRETFFKTRSVDATVAQLSLPKKVVLSYLLSEVPDHQVLTRTPRTPGKTYTSSELTESLELAASSTTGNLSTDAYRRFLAVSPKLPDGRPRPGPQAMMLRFDGWHGALEAAGLPSNPPGGPARQFDDPVAALASVVACWKDLGHPPTTAAYDRWQRGKEGHPSPTVALRLLGSWNTALARAWQIVHSIRLDPEDLDVAVPRRLTTPSPEFLPYRRADEEAAFQAAVEAAKSGITQLESAVRNHSKLQNLLGDALRACGRNPLSPGMTDAKFDLAFWDNSTLFVAEVKSCTEDNLESQLRLGLGQILRYTHQLRQTNPVVKPVLVTQLEPPADWRPLLTDLGVASIHEGDLESGLREILEGT